MREGEKKGGGSGDFGPVNAWGVPLSNQKLPALSKEQTLDECVTLANSAPQL